MLNRILLRAFEAAPDGSNRVVHPISPNNLTRIGKKLVRDGGLAPWRALFQSLRTSCENDLKVRGHAEATYSAWLGHDPSVSRKHYVAPTDREYAAVSRN